MRGRQGAEGKAGGDKYEDEDRRTRTVRKGGGKRKSGKQRQGRCRDRGRDRGSYR